MNSEIYYFSGTGNSFVVARDLSEKIGARLIPVISSMDQDNINTDADIIGFVFPSYDFKPPKLFGKFVKKIKNLDLKYIFAVCTYGIVPSKIIKVFDQMIRSGGGKLSSGYAVKMPHNGIGSGLFSGSQHEMMFKNWKAKLEIISNEIITGNKVKLETSGIFFSLVLSGLIFKMIPTVMKLLKQAILKGWKSLAFISNENCDGCGISEKICIEDNIEMVDGKPHWSDHCAGCFACLHWCPKDAIQTGHVDLNIKKYHHPEARMADIMMQKKKGVL